MTQKLLFPAVRLEDDRLMFSASDKALIRQWVKALPVPYFSVTFSRPFRPRSTGKDSQSHRINGFCAQIAAHTGDDFDTVKIRCKQRAISRGWPFITIEEDIDGVTHEFKVAKSEADASVEEAKFLIEAVEEYAAECGVILEE